MKIMGFNGSPRKNGNTAWVINKVLEGANKQGAETEFFSCSALEIKPCQGCLGCHRLDERGCVINDDMQKLYSTLEKANVLVLGSPVYMGQMSAQTKIFTDRLFAQINPRFSPRFKEQNAGKKLVLVFTQGNPDADMFRVYYDYTKHMFQLLEFEVIGLHVVAGMRSEAACEREGLEKEMKDVGAALTVR